MSDIVAFLNARLDEDERLATRAQAARMGDLVAAPPWYAVNSLLLATQPDGCAEEIAEARNYQLDEVLMHAARHDPARVLREVKAKRAIVELHPAELVEVINADGDERSGVICTCCDDPFPCGTLKLLAMAHAEHPDFQPWWNVVT